MTMTRPTSEQITHNGQILKDVLGPIVNPLTFGAVGDGVADDTAALKAAFDYAIPLSLPVVLRGSYRVTGVIQPRSPQRSVGELHIVCDGHVRITVDPAATAVHYLLAAQFSNPTNVSITGGMLTIDCSEKAAEALYFYNNYTASTTGTVSIECPVTITNCRQYSTGNASGISAFGWWKRIDINDATIINVNRPVGPYGSVCRGITAQVGRDGECTIRRPYIKNILLPSLANTNADGIGVSGEPAAGDAFVDNRLGRVVIEDATFIDCQGRAVKSQCSDTTIVRPKVFRQMYQSPTNFEEFAFQYAGGRLISPTFEYRDNAGTSPLGADFCLVLFWLQTPQFETYNCMTDATVISDVPFREMCRIIPEETSLTTAIVIDGVEMIQANGYTGAICTRGLAEIRDCGKLLVAPGSLSVTVRNVHGPMSGPAIGYGAYTGAAGGLASKIAVEVVNVHSTLPQSTFSECIYQLDHNNLGNLDSFVFRNNVNIRSWISSTGSSLRSFDFAKLRLGTCFCVNLEYLQFALIQNAPPWENQTGGSANGKRVAIIEVLGAGPSNLNIEKVIRVTTLGGNDGDRPKVFVSFDNAVTWRTLGDCPPTVRTADFTVNPTEDVIINNKSGSACVVTLPAAASWPGRRILIKTIQAQAVNSASSNVVPLAGGAAGTGIVSGTAGKYAELVSDGTNWVIMAAN